MGKKSKKVTYRSGGVGQQAPEEPNARKRVSILVPEGLLRNVGSKEGRGERRWSFLGILKLKGRR